MSAAYIDLEKVRFVVSGGKFTLKTQHVPTIVELSKMDGVHGMKFTPTNDGWGFLELRLEELDAND